MDAQNNANNLAELKQQLQKITDPDQLRLICENTLTDMKELKDCLLKAGESLGIVSNGDIVENVKMKDIIGSVMGYATKAMNPFAKKELEEEFSYFMKLAPLAKKYKNL